MVDAFQNTEVYNIVCDSLGLEPKKNNGTIRLPFTVSGQHDPGDEVVIPDDMDDLELEPALLPPEFPNLTAMPPPTPTTVAVVPETLSVPLASIEPEATDDGSEKLESNETSSWLAWFNGKLQAVKDWTMDAFGSHKTKSPPVRL